MFKKLKDKLTEDLKQSPLKIQQFAQSVVSPGSSSVIEPASNENFSIGDETPDDSPGKEGFTVVDLHHPSTAGPVAVGRISRHSSVSSLASDASSAFFSPHDLGTLNMQLDFESASEKEDNLPQLNSISKQELYNAYMKLHRQYQKYKGRSHDLRNYCMDLDKDNKKHKVVLMECQEKSLRRIAELKEQCNLEQHAKAHLEEALRNDLEEKDHLIQTLQTKIKLLQDAYTAHSQRMPSSGEEIILNTFSDETVSDASAALVDLGEVLGEQMDVLVPRNLLRNQQVEFSCDKYDVKNLEEIEEKLVILREEISKSTSQDQAISKLDEILNSITSKKTLDDTGKEENVLEKLVHKGNCDRERMKFVEKDNIFAPVEETKSRHDEENVDEKSEALLVFSGLILMQEKYFEKVSKLTRAFEDYINSFTDTTEEEHEKERRQTAFFAVINEIRQFRDESQKIEVGNNMPTRDEVEELKNKINNQMKFTLETLISVSHIYGTDVNKNIEVSRETECKLKNVREELNITQMSLEEYRNNVEKLKENVMYLEEEREHLKLENKQISKSLDKFDLVKTEMENLMQQKMKLTSTLEAKEEELKALEEKYNVKVEELVLLQENLKEHEMDRSHRRDEIDATIVKLQDETSTMHEIIAELQENNKKYKKDAEGIHMQNSHLCEELAVRKKLLEEAMSEKAEMSTILTNLHAQKEEILEKHKQLLREHGTLKKKLKHLTDITTEVNREKLELKEQIVDLKKEQAEFKEKLDLEQNALIKENEKYTQGRERLVVAEEEIKEVNNEKNVLMNKLESCEKQCEEYQEEIKALKELVSAQEKENNVPVLCQKVEKFTITKPDWNKTLIELEKERNELKKKCDLLSDNLAATEHKLEHNDTLCISLKEELAISQKCLKESSGNEVKMKDDLDDLCCKMKHAKSVQEELEARINTNKEQYTDELEQLKKQHTAERESLHNELVNVQVERDKYISNYSSVEQELKLLLAKWKESESIKLHIENDRDKLQKDCQENALVVTNLDRENMELKAKWKQISDELNLALKKVEENEMKVLKLEKDLQNSKNNLKEITIIKTELSEKVNLLERNGVELKDKLEETTDELSSANKKLEEKDLKLLQLEKDLDNADCILKEITTIKNELNNKVKELEREKLEFGEKYVLTSDELFALNRKVEERDLKIVQLENDLEISQQTLKEITIVENEQHEKLRELEKDHLELQEKYESIKEELIFANEKIENNESKILLLQDELHTAQEGLKIAENIDASKTQEVYERQLNDSKEVCRKLEDELCTVTSNFEKQDLENTELKTNLDIFKTNLDRAKKENDELSRAFKICEEELIALEQKNKEVTQELSSINTKFKEQDTGSSHLRTELVATRVELEEVTCKKAELNELFVVAQRDLEEWKAKYEQISQHLSFSETNVEETGKQNSRLCEELAAIKKSLEEVLEKNKDMNKVLTEFQGELDRTKQEKADLEKALKTTQKKVDDCDTQSQEQPLTSTKSIDDASVMAAALSAALSSCQEELNLSKHRCDDILKDFVLTQQNSENSMVKCTLLEKALAAAQNNLADAATREHQLTEAMAALENERKQQQSSLTGVITRRNGKSSAAGGVTDKKSLSDSFLRASLNKGAPSISDPKRRSLPPSIQSLFDEFQEQNEVYLLASPKERSETAATSPKVDCFEELREKVLVLSQELAETKERLRRTSQQPAYEQADPSDPEMSIEMEYLKNIIFQFMIGKEQVMLAKVISAIMKFDQQQTDQIIHNVLQKQSLLRHLGIL